MADVKRPVLEVIRVENDLPVPSYAHDGDAGMDLHAAEGVTLEPGQRHTVRCGIRIAVPYGWVGLIHPRSGLSSKHGITVINTPGTIDAGYRGEIHVPLVNLSDASFRVERGARIAQLLLQEVGLAQVVEVEDFTDADTTRGTGGFGSTGG